MQHPAAVIDSRHDRVNVHAMDPEDLLPRKVDEPLIQLSRQDLDPLSVEELTLRIEALEAEIARVKNKLDGSLTFRAQADTLFRKG